MEAQTPTPDKTQVVINLASADKTPAFPKMANNRSGGWINFGEKNQFPQDIVRYNSKSPVNSAIIASTVTFICGKGVRDTAAGADKYVKAPNPGETWDDVIENTAIDYITFGVFYGQVIVNADQSTVSVYHQDFTKVRIGQVNEFGEPLSFKISNDWKKVGAANKPVELDVWPGKMEEAETGKPYMFYFWDYQPGLSQYCVPGYFPALEYVKADGTLGEFYNNSLDNGFTPSVVIAMPSNPAPEIMDAFQKKMEGAFAGAKGASSIVVLWGENDAIKPSITPFNASANADIYNNVEGIVFQKIISSHRLSSPTLAGVSGSGNLSGNAAEIIDSYVLFNYTVVVKRRRRILDVFNAFQSINGVAELVIEELDVLKKIRESEAAADQEPTAEEPATLSRKSRLKQFISAIWK